MKDEDPQGTSILAAIRQRCRSAAKDVDIAYRSGETQLGPLLIAASPRGVLTLLFAQRDDRAVNSGDWTPDLQRWARADRAGAPEAGAYVERAWSQLTGYLRGGRRTFDLELDLSLATQFERRVLDILAGVPYGRVETYAGLARSIGAPLAARAVGRALNRNPLPVVLPCHRVVGSSGRLVGYAGGLERKRTLLGLEGAPDGRRQWPVSPSKQVGAPT